jgi:voltage-dependent calcium channel L type alpha-1D
MFVILLNTFILALDRYPPNPSEWENLFSKINLVFTCIFSFECVIKMVGLGLRTFVKDSFNVFDTFTVLMSLVELGMATEEGGGSSFGAMRAVRLFRVFKLFKSGDLRILMDSIAFTVTSIGNYGVLLTLFIYVYALLGMN